MVISPELDKLEQVETCFARLYRSETEVFKLRKPVSLRLGDEWLDLTHMDARRVACLEEARINRQLSPDIACGVLPLTRSTGGRLHFGGNGELVDWALRMQRLPDSDRAEDRLAAHRLGDDHLGAVAGRLAAFHERSRGASHEDESRVLDTLRRRIGLRIEDEGTLRTTRPLAGLEGVEAWQREIVDAEAERFLRRAHSDSILEGHGELALDHVFVDAAGGVQVLAGLEVSPRFRNADVAADIALLATDLAARHRVDLAERFVAEYARLANDFDLYPLLDFYASLRAALRAKLDWLCAERSSGHARTAERYRERARRFLSLARSAPRRALLPPAVVAMGGQVASGKSTLALEIARRIGAPVVGADPTRDHLLGARLNEDLHEVRWEESYAPGFARRVYDEVMRRASEVLAAGRPVVIDGCFRSRARRIEARALARRFALPFLFVEARVSREVQRERLVERARRDSVSIDVWQDIADRLRAEWEPADELSPREHLPLDTSLPPDRNSDAIEARLPTWPGSLTG